uniref:Spermatosis associated 2 like n=1 Tax=Leptobrachium leishanense TaxID=445787 RepID=A0A8C5R5L8_9ANUR
FGESRLHYKEWLLATFDTGEAAPCQEKTVIGPVKDYLLDNPDLHTCLQTDAFTLISRGLALDQDLHTALNRLVGAFQFFEQAALHLYFYPWRKEFWTIHTFSGHYVHVLLAALPEESVFRALRRLGYIPQQDGRLVCALSQHNPENLSMAAFGFLVAQVECHILAGILSSLSLADLAEDLTGDELIRERTNSRGELACIESLKKLTLDVFSAPSTLDFKAVEETLGREFLFTKPENCYLCKEPLAIHDNGICRRVVDGPTPPPQQSPVPEMPYADFAFHECVFIDKCLESRCTDCRSMHSPWCAMLKTCKTSKHKVSSLCLKEKREILQHEERNKYRLHTCLQPGNLPHYRCTSCKLLHYINCNVVLECRMEGHRATMIMLEKDQMLWLTRSTMDLMRLCLPVSIQAQDGH